MSVLAVASRGELHRIPEPELLLLLYFDTSSFKPMVSYVYVVLIHVPCTHIPHYTNTISCEICTVYVVVYMSHYYF